MNELMTTETKNELAPAGLSDPFAAYADAIAPQYIIGEMLRFSKGDYIVGQDDTVPAGTTFTVNLDELMAGWIKWVDNKPVEHIMVRVADGIPPKKRSDLGDDDKALWELDNQDKSRDPWQFTNYLPLMNEKGELFTFTTSSRGGLGAIADLSRRYARHRKRHPNVFPMIALNVDSYQHKIRELGRIKFPVFEPAGYAPKTDFLAALAGAGLTAVESPETAEADPADELNDEVPF
ncbi:MAG TPA: hypothetical protein VER26_09550 [Xanthobacteraceae bacterium]|jgi:hypothetical protein|nr:hypothetical protein [Xanthobacteraceae bacterium]